MSFFQLLKPSTTVHQQLAMLKSRGLIVDDESRALHYLGNIGYYRLSGYFYSFRQYDLTSKKIQRKDEFMKDSHFNDILQLYLFDKKLRLLAFDALERIEMALRVDIGNALARRSPNAHENIEYLDHKQTTAHITWLAQYYNLVTRAKNQDFIQHNLSQYGRLPVWVACEILDFGTLTRLYNLLQPSDKEYIAKKYNSNSKQFTDWLDSLRFIRNTSAHHSRLWNANITSRIDIKKSFPNRRKLHHLENHKPFIYFVLIQHFLNVISPKSTWTTRLIDLIELEFPIVENKAIHLKDFGCTEHFKELLV
ncbi:Abi family protein [Moraxella sp. ZY210820]|uniref:Abi family protein n=1 Tax=unclassified Moraxella TaxID=2685852 RepID=UPI002730E3B3|nr:Abi family protein [Moraxella sp. ZY210820]WLF82988.1 Abi family protein [Moraxella sp. ZY210820]